MRIVAIALINSLAIGCAQVHSSRASKSGPGWKVRDSYPATPAAPSPIAQARRQASTTNPLRGRQDMIDRLVMLDSSEDFAAGEMKYVAIDSNHPARIVMNDTREKTYPRYGTWTSPIVAAEFPFTELIPSWNAHTPAGTGVRFEVRVREAASGRWSPWLYAGQWGRTLAKNERIISCDIGTLHTDNLVLDHPADAYQIRATLESFDLDSSVNPSIRRIAVCYSGQVEDASTRQSLTPKPKLDQSDWARDLQVPFRAQGTAPTNLRGSICSPTSTTMVMAYCGIDRPIIENALAIYDDETDIFGNWNRAVQRAGELGLDAWLTRLRNWDQVKAIIAQNQPVIAAINFERGQFPSSVLTETNGHLIVIRGFTPEGNVICNDPASKDRGNGVIYKADELATAWFKNAGGVAYIIRNAPE